MSDDFPDVKLKALVSFPATILDGAGVDVVKQGGSYQFNIAFDDFAPPVGGVSDPTHQNALLWNSVTGSYTLVPISVIAAGGGVAEAPNDGVQYGRQSLTWTPVVSGGTPSNSNPAMNGVAAPGVATTYSRGDHVHPTDISLAPINSPALTGTPTAPTPAVADNSTKIATTAWVTANAPTVPPAFAAPLMDGTAAVGIATKYAREDHRHPTDTSLAPLISPTFSGVPAAPTAAPATNTTQLATTAFVTAAVGASGGVTPSALTRTNDTNITLTLGGTPATALLQATSITVGWSGTLAPSRGGFGADVSAQNGVPLFTSGVAAFMATTGSGSVVLAISPALTGTPTAPTPAATDNSTKIVTTAFTALNGVRGDIAQSLTAAQQTQARNNIAATGNLVAVTQFTSSSTWNPSTANISSIIVEVWAAGGGSGTAGATAAGQISTAGGGGSGGYSRRKILAPTSQTVTVGVGGSAGGAGGNSSFGALALTVGGGGGPSGSTGAVNNVVGGSQGSASAGDLNIAGAGGMWGFAIASYPFVVPGFGGSAPRGGPGGVTNGGTSAPGNFPGGGGGAGYSVNGGAAVTGGAGAGGLVVVWEFS